MTYNVFSGTLNPTHSLTLFKSIQEWHSRAFQPDYTPPFWLNWLIPVRIKTALKLCDTQ